MVDRIGKRVVVWLPQELIDAIDDRREWRTTSDFIRNTLLDSLMGKAKPKAASAQQPKPEPLSAAEFWRIAYIIESDEVYWKQAQRGYDDERAFIDAMSSNAVFIAAQAANA